jgi:hypothetical protein
MASCKPFSADADADADAEADGQPPATGRWPSRRTS